MIARIIHILALFVLLTVTPAGAADAVYPPSSRIGLVPAPGLSVSPSFVGYGDEKEKVLVLLAELPMIAYEQTLRSILQTGGTTPGVSNVKREVVLTKSGAAHLISADQDAQGVPTRKWLMITWSNDFDFAAMVTVIVPNSAKAIYPDAKLREMFASLSLRKEIPNEEVLGMMPFRFGDLANFRFARPITPGRALLLTDDEKITPESVVHPQLVITIGQGGPSSADERERFAQQLARNIPGLKDMRIVGSESLRIGTQPGHEIKVEAKDVNSGKDLTMVQWIRFGGNGFMRFVGISSNENWPDAYRRFRAVRDGITLR